MALGFLFDNASVKGRITKEDGTVIRGYDYICYGQCLNLPNKPHRDKEAKYYSFIFPDSVSVITKSTKQTDEFISIMTRLNVFRNASYRWVDKKDSYAKYNNPKLYDRLFEYTVDVTTITPQEMFFIGQIVRVMNTAPRVVIDFLEILKLEPDLEEFTCFVLAQCMSPSQDFLSETGGYSLMPHYAPILTGYTVADFHKHVDTTKEYKPVNQSNKYGINNGLENKFYNEVKIADSNIWRRLDSKRRYSKEYLDTFFNKTAFLKHHVKDYKETV